MDVPITNEVWNSAKRLYEAIWAYYMFQVGCITPEDYAHMKSEIGYKESYAQHMKQLVQGIPNDSRLTVQQIAYFLTQYVEFQDPKYAQTIDEFTKLMHGNRDVYKRKAFEILVKAKGEQSENAEADFAGHPPLFELAGMTLPTYCNPLMTALYSRLFMAFVHFNQNPSDP